MKRFLLGAVALVATATLILPGQAVSQTATPALTPLQIIAVRQAGMSLTGGVTDAMKAGIASGAELKVFAEGAEGLVKYGKAYGALFPDGTQTGLDTKAKPEIWTDRAGFEKANLNMVAAAEKLEDTVKSGDKAAFATAFQGLGQTCGACHRAYKAK